MEKATRNIIFRIYPTKKQVLILDSWIDLHRELYNATLQERRDAYQKCGVSLSYRDQQNELPEVKRVRPDLIPLGSHALQETVRRIDRAFQAFFRRLRHGEKPGFPRFKGKERFDSFTYPDPAGWKILEQTNHKGRLHISNIGGIQMRGKPRVALQEGEPRTLTIRRKNEKWYAVISVRYDKNQLRRESPVDSCRFIGLDAGCTALVYPSEGEPIENPKMLGTVLSDLKKAQKSLSRKQKGSHSRLRARKQVTRIHEQVSNQRRDFLHKLSASLVSKYNFISIENLKLKNMTGSARGTKENPGRNVKQKSGLNRSILDAGIGLFFSMLESKAEEAGIRLEKVDPRGTSQRCSQCGEIVHKTLAERVHDCPFCGFVAHRDHNAAINILNLGLSQAGLEQAEMWSPGILGTWKQETITMLPA